MKGNMSQRPLPRLRFPEFRGAKPWRFEPLGELARRSTRKNADGRITRVLTNSAENGVIDQRDFFDKDIATQGNLEGYYIVEEGSYVYNPRISATAPVGPISKNKVGLGVMSPLYTVFEFNNTDDNLYAHYFKSAHWHQYIQKSASTGARHDRMNITREAFLALPLPVSTPEEQQKIADCLSSLDQLISAETQKLNDLKLHKKGLMQQLLPCEGETMPRLRFPEFQRAEGWKKAPLSTQVALISGTHLAPEQYSGIGEVPYFTGPSDFVNDLSLVRKWTERGTSSGTRGDILITVKGSGVGALLYLTLDGVAMGRQLMAIKPRGINGGFVFHFLATQRPRLVAYASANLIPGLSRGDILGLEMPVPEHNEQQKISDCLSSLDDLVAAQTRKLGALKTSKNGLMQQLFPALQGDIV